MHVFDPDHRLYALQGADAAEFLNRLLTLDTRALAVGSASRAFLLDARGRIVLALRLFRVAEDAFWTDLAAHEVEHTRDRFDMFHFGERFAVAPVDTHHLVWTSTADPTRMPEGSWAVPSDRCGPGWDLYVPHGTPVPGEAADTPWRTARRVRFGSPAWPFEYRSDATPLDVGLDGVTEGKGCYPGQEVIERTLALGRPSRRVVRVTLSAPLAPGPLLQDEKPAGELTSVAGLHGLALIKYTRAGPFTREGATVTIVEDDAS